MNKQNNANQTQQTNQLADLEPDSEVKGGSHTSACDLINPEVQTPIKGTTTVNQGGLNKQMII